MLIGVDHVGIGVSDMDTALRFYGHLGLAEVAFDYTGPLPGMADLAGSPNCVARVVMLRPTNPTPLGPGGVRLVEFRDRPTPSLPKGIAWGEIGICEVCIHVHDHPTFFRQLSEERGYESLMDPVRAVLEPHDTDVSLSYFADPAGGKVELIEWMGLESGWPVRSGPHGVNHVAFGVADIDRSREFYEQLGFTGMLFESDGYFEPMHPWYRGTPPRQHMMLLTNPFGAGIEPVQHTPPSSDMRGEWGHLGPMDFAIGTTNIDTEIQRLSTVGVRFLSGPHSIEISGGTWRYAYLIDPDGLYTCLTEVRY